ncbi:MAG TPA: hypothetical protein VNG12_09070 [Acidimicrobiales bacterium]|nr:hypothetical protein [Acidimicrobiales bacterium]
MGYETFDHATFFSWLSELLGLPHEEEINTAAAVTHANLALPATNGRARDQVA